jgi:hypothetical protein
MARVQRLRVKVRKKRPPSALGKLVMRPLREIIASLASLSAPLLRRPALVLPVLAGGLWLGWPLLAPQLQPLLGSGGSGAKQPPPPEVISVFVEDPTRSIWALDLWKQKPGSLLVMQGRPSSQIANVTYLKSQGLWPADQKRLVTLQPGCDTVGQVDALARLLALQHRPGRVTMVTSTAHMPRTLAIARIVLGPAGWKVEGLPVVTEDNRPEDPIRLWRDQLRAHVLRITGLSGTRGDDTCS